MAKWIQLDPEKLNESHRETIGGVEVDVYVSPYDLPNAVSSDFDDNTRRFIIEFEYPGGKEPLVEGAHSQYFTLQVGRFSRRLCRIEADLLALRAIHPGPSFLSSEIERAFEELLSKSAHSPRKWNYQIAQKVLNEQIKEYLEMLISKQ